MAPRGRPRKLAEQRVLEGGTPGSGAVSKRALPKPIVLAPRITANDRPERPTDLPPEALQVWDESIEFLIERNIAQHLDIAALRLMVMHYAMAEQAYNVLSKQGFFTFGSTGQMSEHPAVRIFERASQRFMSYASEFGLTTLARTRMGLLDVARRSMETDLHTRALGANPRRTNRAIDAA